MPAALVPKLVRVNLANPAELLELPGIGPEQAQDEPSGFRWRSRRDGRLISVLHALVEGGVGKEASHGDPRNLGQASGEHVG